MLDKGIDLQMAVFGKGELDGSPASQGGAVESSIAVEDCMFTGETPLSFRLQAVMPRSREIKTAERNTPLEIREGKGATPLRNMAVKMLFLFAMRVD